MLWDSKKQFGFCWLSEFYQVFSGLQCLILCVSIGYKIIPHMMVISFCFQ